MAALELANPDLLAAYLEGDTDLLVAAAEALVRSYCGWHIAPVVEDEIVTVFDGFNDGNILMLPTLQLVDVTDVTVDGTALDLTDLEWSAAGFIRRLAGWWPEVWAATEYRRTATVTMTHGYATVPAEVQAVVLSIAARAVDAVPAGNVSQMSVGQVSRTFATGADGMPVGVALSVLERMVLDRYKIPGLA